MLKRQDRKVDRLFAVLHGNTSMLIVLQDYPDPDAIASAAALRSLSNDLAGIHCSIAHGGVVGRAENRALVKYLDLNLHVLDPTELDRYDLLAMVDTQPDTGNNALPAGTLPHVVVDHHPMKRVTRSVPFTDVRSGYGATSTILYEYFVESGIRPDVQVATALVQGIRSDTQDLGREATQADIHALLALYPMANLRMLSKIEHGSEPPEYFRTLARALQNARTVGRCVVCCVGESPDPDMVAEIADLLERHENADWVLCTGFHGGKMLVSLRASDLSANAGALAQRIVARIGSGGGHNTYAGAQVPLSADTPEIRARLDALVTDRFLRLLESDKQSPHPLMEPETTANP
jgi:nanoRNase/pAp phosphatase (c-di-AMP/oligoRNAs hydrolase)